jgi:hypothetical protein
MGGTLMDTSHDTELKGYCPMLGGQVPFLYCRKCGNNQQPCWKVFDCWWETFDIVEFMQKNLSEDDFRQLLTYQPKARITTLLELIEKTKQ